MIPESFFDGRIQLYSGDSRDVLRSLPDNSFESICCDPPYALVSILERFGSADSAPARSSGATGVYSRSASGFMGQAWDTGETAFAVEFWQQCFRVLKPGGHVAAFGGTRTVHRLACAIEDAGFEIRDQLSWMFGTGFPKSHDIERSIAICTCTLAGRHFKRRVPPNSDLCDHVCPVTPESEPWSGYGTALKPAAEPICLARKPLSEPSLAANVLRWGTGALNIGASRIEAPDGVPKFTRDGSSSRNVYGDGLNGSARTGVIDASTGRWPANVLHDGSAEVVDAFPDVGASHSPGNAGAVRKNRVYGVDTAPINPHSGFADSGSAARFFYQAAKDERCDLCSANIAENPSPTASTPTDSSAAGDAPDSPQHESAGKTRRSNGRAHGAAPHSNQCRLQSRPTAGKSAQTQPLQRIARNVSSAAHLCGSCATGIAREIVAASRKEPLGSSLSEASIGASKKTILLRCLASYVEGRESTATILTTTNLRELFGCAFHAIAENINLEKAGSSESTEPAQKRLWYSSKADADDRLGSKHPTVKPVDLMLWLVRLITPAGGLTLDPFAGTGSTGEAAWRGGFRAVLIEREATFLDDIRRRMALCLAGPEQRRLVSAKALDADPDLGPLFNKLDLNHE